MTLGFFGLVTSTAVTFFGCDSWAIHSTRRRSCVSWMAMPSPQLPKRSRGWWASSRIVAIGSHLSVGLTTAPMLSSAHMRRAVVLTGLLVALATAAAAQSRPLAVRLAIHTSLMGAPDVIAVRQGYFKQEGLDVEWRRFALGKEGRDAMIAGAIDLNATAPTPFLIGLDKGVPYVAIGVNSLFCGSNHLVGLKSSDINTVAHLKGKRIGLPKGTITEFIFVSKVAPAHRLKASEFQIADIPDAQDPVPRMVAKAVDMAGPGRPLVSTPGPQGFDRPPQGFFRGHGLASIRKTS